MDWNVTYVKHRAFCKDPFNYIRMTYRKAVESNHGASVKLRRVNLHVTLKFSTIARLGAWKFTYF